VEAGIELVAVVCEYALELPLAAGEISSDAASQSIAGSQRDEAKVAGT
jgi:hypothetical protein